MSLVKPKVVWFVHGPDTQCLEQSLQQAMRAFPAGTAFFVFADWASRLRREMIASLIARGVVYRETRWARGGNLNGLPAVRGILKCLQWVAERPDDVVWKLDADTMVGDPGVLLNHFRDPNCTGAGLQCPWAPGWWGISYALRAAVLRSLLRIIDRAGLAGLADLGLTEAHEDLVISRTLARHESPSRLRSWMTTRLGGAFCAYNYHAPQQVAQALERWGIVTFGNRWQLAGDEAQKRAFVASSMAVAGAAWRPETAQEWRKSPAESLWMVGMPVRFGKSVVKVP